MRIVLLAIILNLTLAGCSLLDDSDNYARRIGSLEIVASMDINPGNVSVCPNGRIFASIHQFRSAPLRLVEVLPPNAYQPFPNKEWNKQKGKSSDRFVAPLGVQCDDMNRLWVIDNGNGTETVAPKLVGINSKNRRVFFNFTLPESVAKPGSFVQDLAIDSKRGFAYLADAGGQHAPGLITVNIRKKTANRFDGHFSVQAQNIDLTVEGRTLLQPGSESNAARIGVNPITLSADNETLYFGAMNGTGWFSVPTRALRNFNAYDRVKKLVKKVGPKPVSDGASTDSLGNHYFTAIASNSIDVLSPSGELSTLVRDKRLLWPDALSFGPDGWLYIAVNQLHRSAPLNGGKDTGEPPYFIARVWTGTMGIAGR